MNEMIAIVCVRRAKSYCSCGRVSTKLCDFPLTGPKTGKTCDRNICSSCAVNINRNVDYCPTHAKLAGIDQRTGESK